MSTSCDKLGAMIFNVLRISVINILPHAGRVTLIGPNTPDHFHELGYLPDKGLGTVSNVIILWLWNVVSHVRYAAQCTAASVFSKLHHYTHMYMRFTSHPYPSHLQ